MKPVSPSGSELELHQLFSVVEVDDYCSSMNNITMYAFINPDTVS
ncbi:MAG: hypothetical protein ACXAD7_16830 [Candidatus Kariarchaeaceae archaeon]